MINQQLIKQLPHKAVIILSDNMVSTTLTDFTYEVLRYIKNINKLSDIKFY